ncbi:Serine/threonine-protein kinase wnk4 [Trifolium repens]|nr:Serine/threonine-protein kinase wnk4 [Trifolium repens]
MSSCVKGSSSTSNYGSKAQIQLNPMKCNNYSVATESNSYLSESMDHTIIKELSANVDHLLTLETLEGNQFQAVKNRFVRNCQKLTLTSASTTNIYKEIDDVLFMVSELSRIVRGLFEKLPSSETTEEHKSNLASVENAGIEQLPCAETTENVPSLTILPTKSELKGSTSEKTPVATLSTFSGTKDEPPIQIVAPNQKGIEIEGTSKTNNDQGCPVSINDDSNAEEQFSKADEIIIGSKSKPSPSITSPIASQFPSMPSKGDPFLVKRELEQLVSNNHLDYENLSLLTDFLVENPSVRLKDTSLSNRYKGCAYNLLAELLKFLKTHSLLEVSGSSHSVFVELLQDARSFAFDKEWLDGVERRALFPEIQVSPDALEILLDSKKRVAKDVEVLRMKIDFLSPLVENLKHQLTSSEAELESIIQQEAVLSAPIGY